MAGITARSAAARATVDPQKTPAANEDDTASTTSSPPSSSEDLKGLEMTTTAARTKSLQERSRIPPSFYVMIGSILGLECFSGMWSIETLQSWYSSMKTSAQTVHELMGYTRDLTKSAVVDGEYREWSEYGRTAVIGAIVFSLFYVFVLAPFRAGFWTGRRARKQKFHRYMGLAFMTQYAFAWVEFLTNYEGVAEFSFLPHFIAVNGLLQSSSAYLSFKVLPELKDAGYYSDKAVMSRNFVHENIFFALMCLFGSVYYNEKTREVLRSHAIGRIFEYIYVFWPYIVVRTFFPITRFKNAGTTRKGRTARNEKFYEIMTLMVKIFFLWAKYFLGFYMNFMIFLDLVTEENWKFMHGMFLLNVGTVSLAMFLHTLRFKKVLPPRFTFSLYMVQIYATFSAIPFAYDMFISHPKLCALCLSGLLCNMTRNRKVHGVWCFCAMLLLTMSEIDW